MRKKLLREAATYIKQHKQHRLRNKVVRFLACIVVFCTTYALILPAITMENIPCQLEEHTHSASCYEKAATKQVMMLACSHDSLNIHVHTQDCYNSEDLLTCGLADFVVHTHADACYNSSGKLLCQLPEVRVHAHTDSCYKVAEPTPAEPAPDEGAAPAEAPHVHDNSCYTVTQGELICQMPEIAEEESHRHTECCYSQGDLLCEITESEEHYHAAECYASILDCGLEESEPHQHTDVCHEQIKTLICQQEEINEEVPAEDPAVTEPAKETPAEPELICKKEIIKLHSHTAECYEEYLDESNAVQTRLICAETVVLEHNHSEACYAATDVPLENADELTCTMSEDHVHTDLCYGTWLLTCSKEEHTHDLYCRADPTADVETEEIWSATFAGISMTDDWAANVLAIAQTQLGYSESTRNYRVLEDGVTTKGYSRYGAWQEDPYSDWNTLFAMFCLHYGGVQDLPVHADAAQWRDALSGENCGLYKDTADWQLKPGQLVFLSGDSLRVGIVEISEQQSVTVIEGDAHGQVQRVSHSIEEIDGYIDLAEAQSAIEANHEHSDDCYALQLFCTLTTHEHKDSCYRKVLRCTIKTQKEVYLCGLEAHTHDSSCFDEAGKQTCGMEEHTHFEPCSDPNAHIYCWLTEHRHSQSCLSETETILCGLDEHIHDSRCCNYISALIAMIGTLPTSEEAEAILLACEEAEDWDTYAAYQKKVANLAWSLYNAYQDLPEEEKALVTNYDHLMETSWLWSTTTLESVGSRYYPMDNGEWLTESTLDYVHVNKVVPDKYTVDGLILGDNKIDGYEISFQPLFSQELTEEAALELTGHSWKNLVSAGFDSSYGANLLLPADETAKEEFRKNKKNFMVYYDIGTYNGQQVDLIVQIVNYDVFNDDKDGPINGVFGFRTDGTIGFSVCGVSWVQLQYNFIPHSEIADAINSAKSDGSLTGHRMTVRGSASFFDVDYAQAVQLAGSSNTPWTEMLTGIYVTDVTDAVPDLKAVDALTSNTAKRDYFRNWTPSDCVLKIGTVKSPAGPVIYSPHVYDAADENWTIDTKHAFTMTFEHTWFYMFYSFDKGRNAEGGIRHYGAPISKGSLTVAKEVTGVAPSEETAFDFNITFYKSNASGVHSVDTSLNGTYGDVKLVNGVGTFSLKNGASVTLTNIPIREYGTYYHVEELDHDGYVVKTSMSSQPVGGELTTHGPHTQSYYENALQEDSKMAQQQIVVFENYGGPVLPSTGGAGTQGYIIGGSGITFCAAVSLLYCFNARKRRKR